MFLFLIILLSDCLSVFGSVFWDLYCAAPERRDTCEHSSEAKAFHDYVSLYRCGFLSLLWLNGTHDYYLESMLVDATLHFLLKNSNHQILCK